LALISGIRSGVIDVKAKIDGTRADRNLHRTVADLLRHPEHLHEPRSGRINLCDRPSTAPELQQRRLAIPADFLLAAPHDQGVLQLAPEETRDPLIPVPAKRADPSAIIVVV